MTSHLCDTCGKSFAFNKTLLRHQFIQHNISNPQGIGQREYQCSICGMIFKYSELLRRHRLQHEKYLFQCRFCSQPPFSTYNAFRYHTLKFHKEVKCKLCNHPCTGQLEYAKHVKTAHPDVRAQTIVHFKGYSCSQCPSVFATVEELDDHVRSRHQGLFYDCPDCGKQLSSRRGLTVHQRLHNQDSKYRCEDCQRSFTQRGHLLQHIRVHHPESLPADCLLQFSCPDCGKNFKTKSSIKKHRLSKHEGQTYQCSRCLKTFQSKSGFQYHQQRPCSSPAVKLCQQT